MMEPVMQTLDAFELITHEVEHFGETWDDVIAYAVIHRGGSTTFRHRGGDGLPFDTKDLDTSAVTVWTKQRVVMCDNLDVWSVPRNPTPWVDKAPA